MKPNFKLSLGSGLSLVYYVDNEIEVEVIIENSQFSHNVVQYGGGVYIYINNGSGSIEFSNWAVYNNIAWNGGGGVYIEFHNGSCSIEFSNYIIYNNSVYYRSGLLIIALHYTSTSSIHFTNVSFQFKKFLMKLNIYQSGVLLMIIENVVFDQIVISNHNTTAILE